MPAGFVRAVYLGQRKAGEPLLAQTPAAGSQPEQCLLHKPEEQQRPRGCVCTVCHGSAPEIPEQGQPAGAAAAQEVLVQRLLATDVVLGLATLQSSSHAACESPVPAHPVADIKRESCCMA